VGLSGLRPSAAPIEIVAPRNDLVFGCLERAHNTEVNDLPINSEVVHTFGQYDIASDG
jgi:hypothetical protein